MAKRKKFIVAVGSLLLNGAQILKGDGVAKVLVLGEEVPEGLLKAETLKALVGKGRIKVQGGEIESDPETVPIIASATKDRSLDVEGSADGKFPTTGKAAQIRPVGLWDVNPELLAKKSLAQLNVMVQERDKSLKFDTEEAAIKQLSADFVAPPPGGPSRPPKK